MDPVTRRTNDLANTVTGVLIKVIQEAKDSGKHRANSWMWEGDEHHIEHAVRHFTDAGNDCEGMSFRIVSDLDLEHALVRRAMAVWCRRHGTRGDFGRDGDNHPALREDGENI